MFRLLCAQGVDGNFLNLDRGQIYRLWHCSKEEQMWWTESCSLWKNTAFNFTLWRRDTKNRKAWCEWLVTMTIVICTSWSEVNKKSLNFNNIITLVATSNENYNDLVLLTKLPAVWQVMTVFHYHYIPKRKAYCRKCTEACFRMTCVVSAAKSNSPKPIEEEKKEKSPPLEESTVEAEKESETKMEHWSPASPPMRILPQVLLFLYRSADLFLAQFILL